MEDVVVRTYQIIWIIPIALLISTSCAQLGKFSPFGEEEATVSKKQYDELAKKYERLLEEKKLENLTNDENQILKNSSRRQEDQLLTDLNKVPGTILPPVETVDVFDEMPQGTNTISSNNGSTNLVSETELSQQAESLGNANRLLSQNRLSEAMGIAGRLQGSSSKQIQARAKFLSAEILYKQGEYDLSMQMFEDILSRYAFSGIVIKTLGKLVACSEKLRLKAKQEKYYSMMQEFFDS